jgi:hypothetical protein
VAALEGGSHDADVSSSVKGKVKSSVSLLDEVVDDALALGQVGGVDKVG